MARYTGSQSFERQRGGAVSHDAEGRATHRVVWRGPRTRINSFRSSLPKSSPDYSDLKLSRPPDEQEDGPYIIVTAIYGGSSEQVSNSFPNDFDDETPDTPTVTLTANFIKKTATISITDDTIFGQADFHITYRAPINSVTYTQAQKPAQVKGKARSGIESEADPKILTCQSPMVDTTSSTWETFVGTSPLQLFLTTWRDQWEYRTIAADFQRQSNSQFWRATEFWTKELAEAGRVEED